MRRKFGAVNEPKRQSLLSFTIIAELIFSLVFICFLAISIAKSVKRDISTYKIFAAADGFVGLCVIIFAIYDINFTAGMFAGLMGVLSLMFCMPIVILGLIADFAVWYHRKKKASKMALEKDDAPSDIS